MTNNLLIITNKDDITVDIVVDKLNQRKIDYYRLNTEEIGNSLEISINLKNESIHIFDIIKNISIDINDFSSVYYRRPQILINNSSLDLAECEYVNNEYRYFLEGFYKFLSNHKWLNNVYDIRNAENKIFQLKIAKEIGFCIPESLITNNSLTAINFINNKNSCIFKSIKCGFIGDKNGKSRILYTSKVDDNYIKKIDTIKELPTFFQEEIIKDYDIRITVIDNNIFAAEIESQKKEYTKVDWRTADELLPHKLFDLPKDIQEKCFRICKYFNLRFAAIDMIKDKNGNYIFLELNPNGQWGWIEKLLGVPIADSIIDYLIED